MLGMMDHDTILGPHDKVVPDRGKPKIVPIIYLTKRTQCTHKGGKETAAMTIDLTDPIFHDEAEARAWLEQSRWPSGVVCVHCGGLRVAPMGGKKHRPGLWYCPDCQGQFTVQ